MVNTLLAPDLRQLLAENDSQALKEFAAKLHPATTAECLEGLESDEVRRFLHLIDPQNGAEIFGHLDLKLQAELAEAMNRKELASLITHMLPDERVDLLQEIPEETRENLLPVLAQAEREDIRKLISYDEHTAGAVMTSDYVTLTPELTANAAIEKIRQEAPDHETIYYCYVVDNQRRLQGTISLRTLITARPNTKIATIMDTDVICANVHDDQEEVAKQFEKFDFLAVPVVDENKFMVGIVTHDDALDIVQEEATEDILHMAGVGADESVSSSLWDSLKQRWPWLMLYLVLASFLAVIVERFEGTISKYAVLAAIMPVVAGMTGGAGNQTMAVIVRGIALDEESWNKGGQALMKEFALGILNGLLIGIITAVFAWAYFGIPMLGMVVFLSIFAGLTLAGLYGVLFPAGLKLLKFDPALASSILVTTATDISSIVIFLGLASVILP